MADKKILICGIGNKLRKDDGVGPYIIEVLEKHALPEHVQCIDAGVSAFKTALLIGKYWKAIFIDAIEKHNPAGHVYRIPIPMEDFKHAHSQTPVVFSFHESNLENILSTAISLQSYPKEVVVTGCEPKTTSSVLGFSQEVKKSVNTIINLIYKEISPDL